MTVPSGHEEMQRGRAQLQGLRGDPADMAGVRPAQPVGVHEVVQAEGVEADLEGAHGEATMRAAAVRVVRCFLEGIQCAELRRGLIY